METLLRDLCTEHGLTAISAGHNTACFEPITVYLHRDGYCVSGHGMTFDAALANALPQLPAGRIGSTSIKRDAA